jgi:isoleucyl-tRNA synthetase
LLAKWAAIRAVRESVNKAIEDVRTAGAVGSSLQANVRIAAPAATQALLASLGEDLKFVLITSQAVLAAADELSVEVTPSTAQKCERCWHYRDDVGHDAAHPTICGRCTSNLFGAGEARHVA